MYRKTISVALALMLACSMLTGCSQAINVPIKDDLPIRGAVWTNFGIVFEVYEGLSINLANIEPYGADVSLVNTNRLWILFNLVPALYIFNDTHWSYIPLQVPTILISGSDEVPWLSEHTNDYSYYHGYLDFSFYHGILQPGHYRFIQGIQIFGTDIIFPNEIKLFFDFDIPPNPQ